MIHRARFLSLRLLVAVVRVSFSAIMSSLRPAARILRGTATCSTILPTARPSACKAGLETRSSDVCRWRWNIAPLGCSYFEPCYFDSGGAAVEQQGSFHTWRSYQYLALTPRFNPVLLNYFATRFSGRVSATPGEVHPRVFPVSIFVIFRIYSAFLPLAENHC